MEPNICQRKWEEMKRALNRLQQFYKNFIEDGEDSFQGPKDFVNNFFRISYELKEVLKLSCEKSIPQEIVEDFAKSNEFVALSLDIARV